MGEKAIYTRLPIVLAGCFIAAACQTTTSSPVTTEAEASIELPPMEMSDAPAVGTTTIIQKSDGTQSKYEVVGVSDTTMTWRNAEGCEWTQSLAYGRPFAPSVEWRNCDGSSGTTTIARHSGDPEWPLVVGKRWRYQATGQTGSDWNADQQCEVAGTARITTAIGTHDTYEVVCTSNWAKYTRYFSPALGAMVRYQRERIAGSITNDEHELIRIEKPAGS